MSPCACMIDSNPHLSLRMKNKSSTALECPINLFPRQESEIAGLTQSLNQERGAAGKAAYAQALVDAVKVLVDCQSFDQENNNCSLCQSISQLRLKTYNLVVKAGRISRS